jgi:hypothetical protein
MKKLLLALFLAQSVMAHAAEYFDWDNPTRDFDATRKTHNTVRVEWRAVDNVREYCSKLNIARGFGPIKHEISACSTQDGNLCVIITGKKANMHNLGHELRHCFQGNWHN